MITNKQKKNNEIVEDIVYDRDHEKNLERLDRIDKQRNEKIL